MKGIEISNELKKAEVRLLVRLNSLDRSNPAEFVKNAWSAYCAELAESRKHSERGALNIQTITGAILGIFLLVFFLVYMWQTGIPEVISATGNTTAIEAAGATSGQLSFVTMAGGLLVFLLLFAAIFMGMRALGFGGGKGGRHFRRSRK